MWPLDQFEKFKGLRFKYEQSAIERDDVKKSQNFKLSNNFTLRTDWILKRRIEGLYRLFQFRRMLIKISKNYLFGYKSRLFLKYISGF